VSDGARHRVLVIGGGFGGLLATKGLKRADVDVTLVDRRNHHLFQPLLYQVATGALSPGEIATPLRGIFKRQRNVKVVLGEVESIDLDARIAHVATVAGEGNEQDLPYDTLIVAAGAAHSYFGHDDWLPLAPGLKTLEDALEVRRRILLAFEAAEVETDPERRQAWLTFVVVGAGPTGVEMAGQVAEIARDTLPHDFRAADTRQARILLIETADRVLTAFSPSLSHSAERQLGHLGVTPVLGRMVVDIDEGGVTIAGSDGARERLPCRTVIWAAGVASSGLGALLGTASGAEVDRAGRVSVGPDLTLPGHPEVVALGDMVQVHHADGTPYALPGVAPVAMQEGRYAARLVRDRLRGLETAPFRYHDKGNLATIGRLKAVGVVKGVPLRGTIAWLGWLFIHLLYLVGFENRLLVLVRWTGSFITRGRGARLITGDDVIPAPEGGDRPQ
jgi:NADH:quinone reductase (non-electrogenic)